MLDVAPLVRYSIAARTAELRALAQPASLDVGVLDLNVEDHATNAPTVVRRTDESLDLLEDVLAGELLVATGSIAWSSLDRDQLASRTRRMFDLVRDATAGAGTDSAAAHGAARALLTGPLATSVEQFERA